MKPINQNTAPPRKSLLGRINDYVFGYDFFVSYSWADGREYAVALVKRLQDQGFECFLDSSDYAKGDNWRDQGRHALRKTSRLILVGTVRALTSEPVQNELAIFSRLERRILPIDFDGSLANAATDSPVRSHLSPDTLYIKEPAESLQSGPSLETVDAIVGTFDLLRQQQKRTRLFASAALAFAVISLVALLMFFQALRRQAEALSLAGTAQGEAIFENNPVAGLYLARQGWTGLPTHSPGLERRLAQRTLRLAAEGRVALVGTDVLDVELIGGGRMMIAHRQSAAETRDAADLSPVEILPSRIRGITPDRSRDYLILTLPGQRGDARFEFRQRADARRVGTRKDLGNPPPALFPEQQPRYFYSDVGFSPSVRRLADGALLGPPGFDIMAFHREAHWPVFAMAYRDDENSRRPPNAELFDLHSGRVVHQFSDRDVTATEQQAMPYRLIRFAHPGDEHEEASVYATADGYVLSSVADWTLWTKGQSLPLVGLPAAFAVALVDGSPYVLLGFADRTEAWSVVDRKQLGTLPPAESLTSVPGMQGWVVTPVAAKGQSLIVRVVDGRMVSEPAGARIVRVDLRADALDRYFSVRTRQQGEQLRRCSDGTALEFPATVRSFEFSRDPAVKLFAVHYRDATPAEIRRLQDLSLVHVIEHPARVKVGFGDAGFFFINYADPDDRDRLARAELRRGRDGILLLTERHEITDLQSGPGSGLLILETEDDNLDDRDRDERDQRVLVKGPNGYRRIKRGIFDTGGRFFFHPNPENPTLVYRNPEDKTTSVYRIEQDDKEPASTGIQRIGSSESPAGIIEFLHAANSDYLLMGSAGDRMELWDMNGIPHRIFRSQVGLTGVIILPGRSHLLLWYDDGRSYVIDPVLIERAVAATVDEDPVALRRFLDYIEGDLFAGQWLDRQVVAEQQAMMQFD